MNTVKIAIIGMLAITSSIATYAQKSNILIARNSVGKLQEAIRLKKSSEDQLKIISEGLKASDLAKSDRKTKKWPETWAIKSYLSSYVALLDKDTAKCIAFIDQTIHSIDTTQLLDKFGDNAELIKAADFNVNLKMQSLGNESFDQGNYQNAYKYLSQVSDYFPSDTTTAISAALSAKSIKNNAQTEIYFKRALDHGAKSPSIYQELGKIYDDAAHTQDALDIIKQGLRNNPNDDNLTFTQINLLINSGAYDDALPVLKSALKKNSDNKLLNYLQGYIYQRKNDDANAEKSYLKAIDIDRYYFEPLFQLGLIYIGQANKISANKPTSLAEIDKYTLQIEKSIQQMQRANIIEPDNKKTLEILMQLNAQLNKTEKAQEYKNRLEDLN